MTVFHSAPRIVTAADTLAVITSALGDSVLASQEKHGEIIVTVVRSDIEEVLRRLRDDHEYQQLMDIAGVDFPAREERFEVVYMLLSLTKNHRIIIKVNAAENTPVPTVTTLWPVAGWLEREVFDMYGVIFAGNNDLRRILTDYGFEGHPFRKDFPLTGYVELRYSEEDKRVVYEPVELPQDLRVFDFASPWEGADYVLPGDEKASEPGGAAPAPVATKPDTMGDPQAGTPKTTGKPEDTGAGKPAEMAARPGPASTPATGGLIAGQGVGEPVPEESEVAEPGAPDPTEARPDREPRDTGAGAQGGQGGVPEGS